MADTSMLVAWIGFGVTGIVIGAAGVGRARRRLQLALSVAAQMPKEELATV